MCNSHLAQFPSDCCVERGARTIEALPAAKRERADVKTARAFPEATWVEHNEDGERNQYPDAEILTCWRTNQAYAVKMGIEVVDRRFDDKEAERLFCDCHMTGAHAYIDYDVCAQVPGRELMGLEPDPSRL